MNINTDISAHTRLLWLIGLTILAIFTFAGDLPAQDMQHPVSRQRIEDPAEIKNLLTDHTLYGVYVGGEPWTEYHSPDGRTAYREKNCVYQGHWWIKSDLVCFRYDAFNNGQPACFRLYHNGERLDFDFDQGDGKWMLNAYSIDRRLGNPEKLPLEGQACVGV